MTQLNSTYLFDHSDWSLIQITGKDCKSFLHSFCTNDVNSLAAGQVREAFIPDIKGRILGHVFVLAFEDSLLLLATPGTSQLIVPHLTKYLLGVDAQVVDQTRQGRILCLVGDQAHQTLGLATDLDLNEHQLVKVNQQDTTAVRLDVTNSPCYFMIGSMAINA